METDLYHNHLPVDLEQQVNLSTEQSSRGVSLNYILSPTFSPLPDYHWFVMRVPYGKESEVAEAIAANDTIASYVALRSESIIKDGQRRLLLKSALPNTLFAYAREEELNRICLKPVSLPNHPTHQPGHLRFMYDHTRKNQQGLDEKMTVPFEQMLSFIRVTMQQDEHTRIYLSNAFSAKQGDMVEVIDGKFRGVRGRVARLHGQTCILVELEGLCVASTAYVPKAFLKKI